MGFMDECQDILKKQKKKDGQPEKSFQRQLEEIDSFAMHIRGTIKQLLEREEFTINKDKKKIIHFFEPFPNLQASQGKMIFVRNGRNFIHSKYEKKYKNIIEITDSTELLVKKLKELLRNDGIIVKGPYIIHSFLYYEIPVYNPWNEYSGRRILITNAKKDKKRRELTHWCRYSQWWSPDKQKPPRVFSKQDYENCVHLIAVEIKMYL